MKRRVMFAALCAGAVLLWFLLHQIPEKPPAPPTIPKSVATASASQSTKHPTNGASTPDDSINDTQLLTPAQYWRQPIAEKSFTRFHDWAESYLAASAAERTALTGQGLALAKVRRAALKELIQSDPQRALELTVPIAVRRVLPAAVEVLLEERVSDRGDLTVLAALPEPGREAETTPGFRTARIGEREFAAHVYDWRLGEPTRWNIPLHGIAVDGQLAVSAHPIRILEPDEALEARGANPDAACAVCGQRVLAGESPVAAELGGKLTFFCGYSHAVQASGEIIAGESGPPGPQAADEPQPSAWTEGVKRLIFIRVDFPNLAGTPVSDTTLINLMSNLNSFYTEMSYGRAGFDLNGSGSGFTPTFRMSQPAEYYGTNNYYNQLRTEARNAAAAAGYTLANYNLDLICMGSVPGWTWAGLAYVGASGVWLRNSFGTGVAGHELGHNYGLNHANYWNTSGQSIIGPGTSVEYGDIFDTMGSASAGNNHFNARFKNYLNWLTINEVVTATSNGVYRIYTHDNPNSPGIRGLRIVKNSQTNYWVEFRQKFTSNKWMMSGGGLRWAGNGNQKSQLLDTTPGTTDGKTDSPLVIGRTFSDLVSNIHITPVCKGNTTPESLDVVVNLGAFPGNQSPVVDILASATNAGIGVTLTFDALAADPNGDALAYYWNFGDGNFGTNGPIAAKSWTTTGEYVVRCEVSDMKGGVGSKSVIVRIGSPTTYRIAGQVQTTSGPLQGVRVSVSTTRMAWTDSDGTFTIPGLPAGNYTVAASLENYSFVPTDFANPVSVGPNQDGVNFIATCLTPTAPAITTQPLSQMVNVGTNVTFSITAAGSTPLYYQWRFNSANIAGATDSRYTRSNVQTTNAGNYSVVVSNLVGSTTSTTATLKVLIPPQIIESPQSERVVEGGTISLSVLANGQLPLTYQWRFNEQLLTNATSAVWSSTNALPSQAGNYDVLVSNVAGSVTSAPAGVIISVRPLLSGLGVLSNGQPQFTLSGTPGDLYTVQTSTNLLDWQDAATVTNETGAAAFTDAETNASSLKLYRARLLP